MVRCDGVGQPVHVFRCGCSVCAPKPRHERLVVDLRQVASVWRGDTEGTPLTWTARVGEARRLLIDAAAAGDPAAVHCFSAGGVGSASKCGVPVRVGMHLLQLAPSPQGVAWLRGLFASGEYREWVAAHCSAPAGPAALGGPAATGGGGGGGAAAAAPVVVDYKAAFKGASAILPCPAFLSPPVSACCLFLTPQH